MTRATKWGAMLVAAVIALAACGGNDDDDSDTAADELTRATLVLNWTPNAHHIGVYAAQAEGWYEEEGIDLEIVEPTVAGAEQAVGAGEAEFGISIAEGVLPARAEGVPIVSIATILPVNDSALMSLATDGIDDAGDLGGHTYGGYGGPLETELINRLAECGGADPTTVKHVEVGNVDYLAGMEADRFDFAWVFAGWDGLRASEIEGVDVDFVRFDDYLDCIPNWYTPLFITSEDLLTDDPELVRAFLRATARGYEYAISDPAGATDAMMREVPEMDEPLLRVAAEYYSTRFTVDGAPFGTQDTATWEEFDAFLVEAGLLTASVPVDETFTNDYLP